MPKLKKQKTPKNRRMKNPDYLTFNPYTDVKTEEQLEQIRRSLAKQANQRLVRLERATSPITGESYGSYGSAEIIKDYLRAQKKELQDAGVKTGQKLRFRERADAFRGADDSYNKLRQEIFTLQSFLSSSSSTVRGQKTAEQKRIETFESGVKIEVSYDAEGRRIETPVSRPVVHFSGNKDFYDFLNSSTYKNLLGTFTSEEMIEIWDAAKSVDKRRSRSITDAMQEALDAWREGEENASRKSLNKHVEDLIGKTLTVLH